VPTAKLASIGFLGLLLLTGCGGPPQPPPIVIGHIAPRSGPERERGLDAERAILMAVEEANAAEGQVMGRQVVVLHPDSHANPEAAQNVAVRLLAINRVAALVGSDTRGSGEPLCRTAQQYKTPFLTAAWAPPSVLSPYGFCVGPTPQEQGKALAQLADKGLQVNKVAVLTDNRSTASVALTAAFVEVLGKAKVATQREYDSDKDFERLAGEVKEAKAILVAGTVADLEKLCKELQKAELPVDVPILFGGAEDERLPALADAGKNDLWWTTVFVADGGKPKAKEFARKFEESFHRPAGSAAALAYDSARLLFQVIGEAKTTKGDKLREELLNLKDFDSLTGPLSFDKNQVAVRPVFVVHRKDKQTKVLGNP
jgi:branched-chain amino acid transport system substrate-binding protein